MLDIDQSIDARKRDNGDSPPQAQESRWPRHIKIGERHRKDYGDLAVLARSINNRGGLIHPIAITAANELIAGERRLKAWQLPQCLFHDQPIPVTVIDIDSIVAGESDENDPELRKNFTPSEAVAIARVLRPRLEAQAKERQREHSGTAPGRKVEHSGQVATSVRSDGGRTRDKIAKATGKGARSLAKAEAIVSAAEAEPEKFGKLVEDIDRTGRVDGPYKRLQIIQQGAAIRNEPPPFPSRGPYRVIVVDPPWPAEPDSDNTDTRAYYPYPTMTIAQICAVPVASIASSDCVLWLWVTNFHMPYAFKAIDVWGFKHKTILTWVKDKMGHGQRLRGKTEHCILAVRGKPIFDLRNQTTILEGKSRVHSEKPFEFYLMVEHLCPASRYAEFFGRGLARSTWDRHGDQVVSKFAGEIPPDAEPAPTPHAHRAAVAQDDGLDLPNFLRRGHPDCFIGCKP